MVLLYDTKDMYDLPRTMVKCTAYETHVDRVNTRRNCSLLILLNILNSRMLNDAHHTIYGDCVPMKLSDNWQRHWDESFVPTYVLKTGNKGTNVLGGEILRMVRTSDSYFLL